ncbi:MULTISPECIES: carbohydrate-binding protein [unclassified Fibrobacter]|uniref:carbohydrate-binding protein n=1 Tax=unclassified Fibrobacter TaxID=2634177 RepID=UPI000D6D81D4|nr:MULTISPECIES: carbohydrate-binding protein [unclassified Fibrobacter]PWJ61494.1 alpha-galactosidase [Fibrobacter sp. UWR4]PZW67310.1 alpha-galactosidase [Fibrobacter sp. UWR1]
MSKNSSFARRALATVAFTAMGFAASANAHPDSLVLTPPLGWNSWNVFHENINETQIKEVADAMVSSGLRDAGYIYLNLDDNWMDTKRDANGDLQNHPKTFPSGMKALADYIHKKGLKFGVYGDRGKRTCHHYNSNWDSENGSYMHEEQDAKKFAEWGVDYLKYDNCDPAPGSNQEADYTRMSKALRNSGRDIVFSICAWEYKDWMPKIAHLWRTTFDIGPEWRSTSWYRGVYEIIDANDKYWKIAKPGNWNDPDMLEVDNRNLTYEEQKSQMTMWSIMAAPIMISSDVRKMSDQVKDLYLNKDMIAINQDSLGVQGHRISNVNGKQVWTKPLRNGDLAVALLNDNTSTQTIEVNFKDIGVEGEVEVRDAWQKKDLGPRSSVSAEVPAHGSVLLRLVVKPVPREPFGGKAATIPGKIEMENFDIPGTGAGNASFNEMDSENHGDSDLRPGTGVDLYKKATGVIVGYNQAGEWLEYTVNVAETGEYTLFAAVASAGGSAFSLSMDGKAITEVLDVPAAASGEDSYDDYNKVEAKVNLTKGEHILRFTVEKDWMDIDYINFTTDGIDTDPICKDVNGSIIECEENPEDPEDPKAIAKVTGLVKASESYNVFGAIGKFMGRVDVVGNNMTEALKNAGFAKGVYMVRGVNGGKVSRVLVK